MWMNKKLISIFILLIYFSNYLEAQNLFVNGYIKESNSINKIKSAEIYDLTGKLSLIQKRLEQIEPALENVEVPDTTP